jgi:hypothetical protein
VPRFLPVPIDGRELSCHDKIVQMASKKQGARASAGSPVDSVPEERNGPGGRIFKSGFMFSLIDFGASHKIVRAAEGN